jgi:hypothetical protein
VDGVVELDVALAAASAQEVLRANCSTCLQLFGVLQTPQAGNAAGDEGINLAVTGET